jgi:hypothetical protein
MLYGTPGARHHAERSKHPSHTVQQLHWKREPGLQSGLSGNRSRQCRSHLHLHIKLHPVSGRKCNLLAHCFNHSAWLPQRRKRAKDSRPSCHAARALLRTPLRVRTAPSQDIEALSAVARNVRCLPGWMRGRRSKCRERDNSATLARRNGLNPRRLPHHHLIDEHGRSPKVRLIRVADSNR